MLGRKDYTADEIRRAEDTVAESLRAFADVGSPETGGVFFNSALLALDRRFVHRLRKVSGKGNTPLNEVELLVASLIDHDGLLKTNKVITYVPEQSVLGLEPGDRIALTSKQFARLTQALFEELARKYL